MRWAAVLIVALGLAQTAQAWTYTPVVTPTRAPFVPTATPTPRPIMPTPVATPPATASPSPSPTPGGGTPTPIPSSLPTAGPTPAPTYGPTIQFVYRMSGAEPGPSVDWTGPGILYTTTGSPVYFDLTDAGGTTRRYLLLEARR